MQSNFVKTIKRIRTKMKSSIYNQFQLEDTKKLKKYLINSNRMKKLKQIKTLGPKK